MIVRTVGTLTRQRHRLGHVTAHAWAVRIATIQPVTLPATRPITTPSAPPSPVVAQPRRPVSAAVAIAAIANRRGAGSVAAW